jgi:hypothetical protein
MSAKDVAKWTASDWQSKLKFMRPSGGGAVGVAFCWTEAVTNSAFDHKNLGYGNVKTCKFVLKPVKGPASGPKFAEKILGKLAGTSSPNSKPIPRNGPIGIVIQKQIFRFASEKPISSEIDYRDVWKDRLDDYIGADYYLAQDFVDGAYEMGDEVRKQNGLRKMLKDRMLMINLGRLFVADAVLGNGDRLCQLNTGNIMYSPNGQLWAIDSSTVLTKYTHVVNDFTWMSWGEFFQPPTPDQWGKIIVNNGGTTTPDERLRAAFEAGKGGPPKAVPGFAMKVLFSPDLWWDKVFKSHLLNTLDKENALGKLAKPPKAPLIPPKTEEWAQGKIWFKQGVEQGLRGVDQKLQGLSWLYIKAKYKSYVTKYGGDANVDWTNLKIRRMYIKARQRNKTADEAMSVVQDYVARKYQGV